MLNSVDPSKTPHCEVFDLGLHSLLKPVCPIDRESCNFRKEPAHDKTYKMACKDSDQPGHPPSLISLRCPHEESLGP